jgi:hypothetical protein
MFIKDSYTVLYNNRTETCLVSQWILSLWCPLSKLKIWYPLDIRILQISSPEGNTCCKEHLITSTCKFAQWRRGWGLLRPVGKLSMSSEIYKVVDGRGDLKCCCSENVLICRKNFPPIGPTAPLNLQYGNVNCNHT